VSNFAVLKRRARLT